MLRGASPVRILLIGYAAVIVLSCLGSPVGMFDESIPLVQSRLIAHGLKPYVDFFSFYPPLAYYMDLAACFLLGETIVAQRLVHASLYVIVLFAAGRVLRIQFPEKPYLSAYIPMLLAIAVGPRLVLASWPATAVALLALFTYLAGPTSRPHLIGAAFLSSAALFYRINFGAYAGFAIAVCIALDWLERPRPDWRLAATFVGSLAAFTAVWSLLFYGSHLSAAIEQSILIPARAFSGLRFLPLPEDLWWMLPVVFPCAWFSIRMIVGAERFPRKAIIPLALGLAFVGVAQILRDNPRVAVVVVLGEIAAVLLLHLRVHRLQRFEFCFVLFFACSLHYFLSRADDWHAAVFVCLAPLFLPYVTVTRGSSAVLTAAAGCVILAIPAYGPAFDRVATGTNILFHGQLTKRISDFQHIVEAPALWTPLYTDNDEIQAVSYIRQRSSPSEAVFVGEDSHYSTSWNDIQAYWLLERPVSVFYYVFEPSLTPTPAIQQTMIADLQRTKTRWALVVIDEWEEPAFSTGKYPQSHLLDEFLAANFHEVRRFGSYAVLLRNGSST